MASKNDTSFPSLSDIGLEFPSTPLLVQALEYGRKHTSEATVNHTVRSAYFAIVISKKLPPPASSPPDLEAVLFSLLMHDLGWSNNEALISKDKRFEVDGANISRDFLHDHAPSDQWDKHRVQLVWDTIALHTISSIAMHKQPEVMLAHLSIFADFAGPNMPGGMITPQEFKAIMTAWPRAGFRQELKQLMCGFCRTKRETTFDNFVSGYGLHFGLDGNGTGKEEYKADLEAHNFALALEDFLGKAEAFE